MANENVFQQIPRKRIHPYDGMAITDKIWEQAHAYHDANQQNHNLFFHGPGIVSGLEVIASDPPDRLVIIHPGLAVDSAGKLIVLPNPVAYDVGDDSEGLLYLVISYRESDPSSGRSNGDNQPSFVEAQFRVAARASLPEGPMIELARFTRENRGAPIRDATDPLSPRHNEIDLRHRRVLRTGASQLIHAGVIYLGGVEKKLHGKGLAYASRELQHIADIQLSVDDALQLSPTVLNYDLLILVGEEGVKLTQAQVKGLQGYLEHGGSLILESCNEAAHAAFIDLAGQFGVGLRRLADPHPLLMQPFRFAAPPAGRGEQNSILAGDGIILSDCGHLLLLAGESSGSTPTREQMRAAVEWLANVLTFTLERRAAA